MKRRDFLKLSAALGLSGLAAACGESSASAASPASSSAPASSAAAASAAPSSSAASGAASEAGGKTLVAVFSATGNTLAVAQMIAEATGADLFTLEPVEPYTDADLNYNDSGSRTSRERADAAAQQSVALEAVTPDGWADYDTIYLGYPIWWGGAAWPVNGFVTGNDFAGKRVVPFCTSASSGLGSSADNLAGMASGGDWAEGRRFSSRAGEDEVLAWLAEL